MVGSVDGAAVVGSADGAAVVGTDVGEDVVGSGEGSAAPDAEAVGSGDSSASWAAVGVGVADHVDSTMVGVGSSSAVAVRETSDRLAISVPTRAKLVILRRPPCRLLASRC